MPWTSPIAWATIRNALWTWVYGQLGITTVWGRQDAPARAYPYALLDIIAGPTPVHGDRRAKVDLEDTTMKIYVIGDRTVTVSIEALVSFEGGAWNYDQDASAMMTLLQASLNKDSVRAAMNAAGIGVLDMGATQDRRTALDAGWISRAGFDLTIHCVSLIDVGTVETVETIRITSDFDSPADFEDVEIGPDS